MLAAEPREAVVGAHLLVGGRDEDHVAGGLEAFPRERGDGDGARSRLTLHVKRAAAPDLVVAQLSRPRIDAPLRRVGEHGVGVREEEQPWPSAAPWNPRDQVRPLRHLRVQLARDAAGFQVRAQVLRGDRLVAGRVDGVEADELLEELRRLLAQRDRRHQRRVPRTSR
jgi:hypothetical protein